MTRMTGPDCVVMCNLINTHTHTRNGDGSGDGNESNSGDGNGDEDGNGNGNEDRIGEGEGEAKKRKKPHMTGRCHVGNEGDLGAERGKKRREERVGPVASNSDNLENNKEAGAGEHKVLSAQVRIVQ